VLVVSIIMEALFLIAYKVWIWAEGQPSSHAPAIRRGIGWRY
jgi:hypothetical protein